MSPLILNRRAKREYEIIETFEAGIILSGPEVKSLRLGKANIGDAYADPKDGELWLINCHISEYNNAQKEFHDYPTRPRKLLLHKRELINLKKKVDVKGVTMVPLSMYFKSGKVKVEFGLARGKKNWDKRQSIMKKDLERQTQRTFKGQRISL